MHFSTHHAEKRNLVALPPPGIPARMVRVLSARLDALLELECLCTAAVAFWIYFLVPRNTNDPDIGWHLRNAAEQIGRHTFLHADIYSFTARDAPWINHEWLAELPFYLAVRLDGPTGVYAVTLLTIECIFLAFFRLTLRALPKNSTSSLPLAMLVTLAASLLGTVSFGPRTLLFGWVLLLIELRLLSAFAQRPRCLYALPCVFALWINTHGSWLIGLVLFAVFIVAGVWPIDWGAVHCIAWSKDQRKILGLVLLLSTAALFLNPYGWRLVGYPFDLAFHQPLNIANVEEWRPLNFHSVRGGLFLTAMAALFLTQLANADRRRWSPCELMFLALGTYAAVIHERFLFLAALLMMPLLAGQLAQLRTGKQAKTRSLRPAAERWMHAVFLLAMLLLVIRISFRNASIMQLGPTSQAADVFLTGFHPRGRVFNAYGWGGDLIYAHPQIPIFIDSRVDLFERNGVLRDYLAIIRLQNSLQLLDRYRIRYVLFERDTPLVYLLLQTHQWRTDFDDKTVIMLERMP
jgi:hypothetical protein